MSALAAPPAAASREIAGQLSTAPPFSARLAALEEKRLAKGLSRGALADLACISERALRYAMSGIVAVRASTLRKLERAVDGYRPEPAIAPNLARAAYRGFLVALANEAGIDPAEVVSADPHRERGAVARCRMRAFYLMVTEFDLTMTAVARLAGVTKQAVSKSIPAIEDERDEPALDAMLARVARQVGGREG